MPRTSRMRPVRAAAFELLERGDAELLVQLADRARAEAGYLERAPADRPGLAPQALVEAQPARVRELGQLVVDGLADAGQAGRIAGAIGLRDAHGAVGDGVGGAAVGDALEDQLALEVHHVAALGEDAGQDPVVEQRHVVAARGARPRLVRRLLGVGWQRVGRLGGHPRQCAAAGPGTWGGSARGAQRFRLSGRLRVTPGREAVAPRHA